MLGRASRRGRAGRGSARGGAKRGGAGATTSDAASSSGSEAAGRRTSRRSRVCWSWSRAAEAGAPSSTRSVSTPSTTASTMAGPSSSR